MIEDFYLVCFLLTRKVSRRAVGTFRFATLKVPYGALVEQSLHLTRLYIQRIELRHENARGKPGIGEPWYDARANKCQPHVRQPTHPCRTVKAATCMHRAERLLRLPSHRTLRLVKESPNRRSFDAVCHIVRTSIQCVVDGPESAVQGAMALGYLQAGSAHNKLHLKNKQ